MSFIRTGRNISAVPETGYTAEQFLGILLDLVRDVYEEAGVKKASVLPVDDKKKLLTTMHSLSKILVDMYASNQDGIGEFVDEDFREEISQRANALMVQEATLASVAAEIAAEEEKQIRLNAILEEVTSRRGHLLTVKEECDAIQQRIDQLNDTALDEMAAKKVILEAELAQRTARAEELAADQAQLQSETEALEERLTALNTSLEAVREQHEALKAEEASATEEKARLEESIEAVRVQLEEAKQRIGDLPAISERINTEYQEIQMQMTVMLNALNSAKSDAFLTENLYALPGSSNAFTVENYPDLAIAGKKINSWNELEAWFAELEERIDGLLEVLRTMLSVLVKKAESITAQKDQ